MTTRNLPGSRSAPGLWRTTDVPELHVTSTVDAVSMGVDEDGEDDKPTRALWHRAFQTVAMRARENGLALQTERQRHRRTQLRLEQVSEALVRERKQASALLMEPLACAERPAKHRTQFAQLEVQAAIQQKTIEDQRRVLLLNTSKIVILQSERNRAISDAHEAHEQADNVGSILREVQIHNAELNARLAALQHQHESDEKYIKTLRDELTAVATKTSSEDGTEQQQIASLKDQLARLQHEHEIQLSNMQAKHEAALKTVAVSANLAVQSTREKDAKADQLQKELVSANQKLQETRLQKEHSDKDVEAIRESLIGYMRIAEQEQHQQTIELARVNTLYQQLSREKDETIANLSQKIQVESRRKEPLDALVVSMQAEMSTLVIENDTLKLSQAAVDRRIGKAHDVLIALSNDRIHSPSTRDMISRARDFLASSSADETYEVRTLQLALIEERSRRQEAELKLAAALADSTNVAVSDVPSSRQLLQHSPMQHQDDAPLAFWSQSSQLYDENSDPSGENQPSSSNANQESDPPVPLESVRTKLEERRGKTIQELELYNQQLLDMVGLLNTQLRIEEKRVKSEVVRQAASREEISALQRDAQHESAHAVHAEDLVRLRSRQCRALLTELRSLLVVFKAEQSQTRGEVVASLGATQAWLQGLRESATTPALETAGNVSSIADLQQQVSALLAQQGSKAIELASYAQQVQDLEAVNAELQQELRESNAQQTAHESLIQARLTKQRHDSEDVLDRTNAELRQLRQQEQLHHKTIESLLAKVAALERAQAEQTKLAGQYETQVQRLQQIEDDLNGRLEAFVQREQANEQGSRQQEAIAQLSTVQTREQEVRAQLASVQAREHEVRAQLASVQAREQEVRAQLASSRTDVTAIQAREQEALAQLAAARSDLASARTDLEAAQVGLAAARAREQEANALLSSARVDQDVAKALIAARAEIDAAKVHEQDALKAANAREQDVRAELKNQQAETAQARAMIEEQNTLLEARRVNLEEALARLLASETECAEHTSVRTNLERLLHELQQQLERISHQQHPPSEKLTADLDLALRKLQDTQTRLESTEGRLQELEAERENQDTLMATLTAMRQDAEGAAEAALSRQREAIASLEANKLVTDGLRAELEKLTQQQLDSASVETKASQFEATVSVQAQRIAVCEQLLQLAVQNLEPLPSSSSAVSPPVGGTSHLPRQQSLSLEDLCRRVSQQAKMLRDIYAHCSADLDQARLTILTLHSELTESYVDLQATREQLATSLAAHRDNTVTDSTAATGKVSTTTSTLPAGKKLSIEPLTIPQRPPSISLPAASPFAPSLAVPQQHIPTGSRSLGNLHTPDLLFGEHMSNLQEQLHRLHSILGVSSPVPQVPQSMLLSAGAAASSATSPVPASDLAVASAHQVALVSVLVAAAQALRKNMQDLHARADRAESELARIKTAAAGEHVAQTAAQSEEQLARLRTELEAQTQLTLHHEAELMSLRTELELRAQLAQQRQSELSLLRTDLHKQQQLQPAPEAAEENKKLTASIERLHTEIEGQNQLALLHQAEISRLKMELEAANAFAKETPLVRSQLATVRSELQAQNHLVAQLQTELSLVRSTAETANLLHETALDDQAREHEELVGQLRTQLDRSSQDFQGRVRKIDDEIAAHAQKAEEQHQAQLDRLRSAMGTAAELHRLEILQLQGELQQQTTGALASSEEQALQIANLQSSLAAKTQAVGQLQRVCDDERAETTRLRAVHKSQIDLLTAELESLRPLAAQQSAELVRLRADLAASTQANDRLKSDLVTVRAELLEQTRLVGQKLTDLARAGADASVSAQSIERSRADAVRLMADLEVRSQTADKYRSQLESLQADLESRAALDQEHGQEVSRLRSDLAVAVQTAERHQAELVRVRAELDSVRTKSSAASPAMLDGVARLRSELEARSLLCDQQAADLGRLRSELDSSTRQAEASRADLAQARMELATAAQSAERHQLEISRLRSDLEANTLLLERQTSGLHVRETEQAQQLAEIAQLRSNLDASKAASDLQLEEAARLRSLLDSTLQELSGARDRISTELAARNADAAKCAQLEAATTSLRSQVAQLEAEAASLRSQLADAASVRSQLETQAAALRAQLAKVDAEAASLRAQLAKATEESSSKLVTVEASCTQLHAEVTSLNTQLAKTREDAASKYATVEREAASLRAQLVEAGSIGASKLATVESLRGELETEAVSLRAQLSRMTEDSKAETAALRAQLSKTTEDSRAESSTLRAQLSKATEESTKRIRQLESEVSSLLSKLEADSTLLRTQVAQQGQLERELQAARAKLDDTLRSSLETDTAAQEVASLRSEETDALRSRLSTLEAEATSLRLKAADAERLRSELATVRSPMAASSSSAQATTSTEIEGLRAQLSGLLSKVGEAETFISRQQSEVASLRAQVSAKASEADTLRRQLLAKSADVESLRAQTASSNTEIEALRTQVSSLHAKAAEPKTQSQAEHGALTKAVQATQTGVDSLRAQRTKAAESKQVEVEALRTQLAKAIEAKQLEIESLHTQAARATEAKQAEFTQLTKAAETRQAEIEALRAKAAEVKTLNQAEIEALRTPLRAKAAEADSLRSQLASKAAEIEALRKQISSEQAKAGDVEALRTQISAVQTSADQFQSRHQFEVDSLRSQLVTARSQHADGLASLQARSAEVSSLKSQVSILQSQAAEAEGLRSQVKALEADARALSVQLGKVQRQHADTLEREICAHQAEVDATQSQLVETQETVAGLRTLIRQAQAQEAEAQETVARLRSQVSQAQAQHDVAEALARQEVDRLQQLVLTLEQQVAARPQDLHVHQELVATKAALSSELASRQRLQQELAATRGAVVLEQADREKAERELKAAKDALSSESTTRRQIQLELQATKEALSARPPTAVTPSPSAAEQQLAKEQTLRRQAQEELQLAKEMLSQSAGLAADQHDRTQRDLRACREQLAAAQRQISQLQEQFNEEQQRHANIVEQFVARLAGEGNDENAAVHDDKNRLIDELARLRAENKDVKADGGVLREQNRALVQELALLKDENGGLRERLVGRPLSLPINNGSSSGSSSKSGLETAAQLESVQAALETEAQRGREMLLELQTVKDHEIAILQQTQTKLVQQHNQRLQSVLDQVDQAMVSHTMALAEADHVIANLQQQLQDTRDQAANAQSEVLYLRQQQHQQQQSSSPLHGAASEPTGSERAVLHHQLHVSWGQFVDSMRADLRTVKDISDAVKVAMAVKMHGSELAGVLAPIHQLLLILHAGAEHVHQLGQVVQSILPRIELVSPAAYEGLLRVIPRLPKEPDASVIQLTTSAVATLNSELDRHVQDSKNARVNTTSQRLSPPWQQQPPLQPGSSSSSSQPTSSIDGATVKADAGTSAAQVAYLSGLVRHLMRRVARTRTTRPAHDDFGGGSSIGSSANSNYGSVSVVTQAAHDAQIQQLEQTLQSERVYTRIAVAEAKATERLLREELDRSREHHLQAEQRFQEADKKRVKLEKNFASLKRTTTKAVRRIAKEKDEFDLHETGGSGAASSPSRSIGAASAQSNEHYELLNGLTLTPIRPVASAPVRTLAFPSLTMGSSSASSGSVMFEQLNETLRDVNDLTQQTLHSLHHQTIRSSTSSDSEPDAILTLNDDDQAITRFIRELRETRQQTQQSLDSATQLLSQSATETAATTATNDNNSLGQIRERLASLHHEFAQLNSAAEGFEQKR